MFDVVQENLVSEEPEKIFEAVMKRIKDSQGFILLTLKLNGRVEISSSAPDAVAIGYLAEAMETAYKNITANLPAIMELDRGDDQVVQ